MKHLLFLCTTLMLFSTLSYSQTKTASSGAAAPGPARPGPQPIGVRGLPQPAIGDIATDFLQFDVNGKPVHLSDFKGKWVLLDFWGSMCAPCRREHPHLIQLYNQYKDKNFTILSVSVYDMPLHKDRWVTAIQKDQLPWTNVSSDPQAPVDPNKKFNEAAFKYGIGGLPRNFLIDPSGKIVALDLKGELLEQKLSELLQH